VTVVAYRYELISYPDRLARDGLPFPDDLKDVDPAEKLAKQMTELGERGFRFVGAIDGPSTGSTIVMELDTNQGS